MAKSQSTFQKKAKIKIGQIPGTRPSLQNNQLLVSTGIPSFDVTIGTGLAVGTVLLVEEDAYGSYSKLMLKYFASEAIMSQQSLFLASASIDPTQFVKELPAAIDDVSSRLESVKVSTDTSEKTDEVQEDKMKIAWRYQNTPKIQSTPVPFIKFGHYYDLTGTMNQELVDNSDISYFTPTSSASVTEEHPAVRGMNVNYWKMLQDIRKRIKDGQFGVSDTPDKRQILRIGIHSLGSPLWGDCGEHFDSSLSLFLLALRGILRKSLAVCMITVPTHLFQEEAFVKRIERLADSVVRLESFADMDKEKNPLFKDYHGLLHIIQLPRLNSMVPPTRDTADFAFKLRRKKFLVEKFHLPPQFSEEDTSHSSHVITKNTQLDF